MESLIALLALTAMEIVLGIDNIIFIAILTDRLREDQRSFGRKLGLAMALITRIMLLCSLTWILGLKEDVFQWTDLGVPTSIFDPDTGWFDHPEEAIGVSVRDLILLVGGLFLIGKTVHEIHGQMEGGHHGDSETRQAATLKSVVIQIAILDIVFSLDSVITAVGMVKDIKVMITAVILAVGVMVLFADRISAFVSRHPTLKMLALSFLMLIGVMLFAESIGSHIEKGYVYFAMAFSLLVEMLNLRVRTKHVPPEKLATPGG
jgi:predicted tellurium resistance membrane protein TerC